MREVMTSPFAVAALVLCAAGVAKLRSPGQAVRALHTVGLPAGAALVRLFAVAEVALGAWCIARPGPVAAAMLALVYAFFVPLSAVLARRHTPCGCFGERELPVSAAQPALSAVLALVAVVAAASGVHGFAWLLGRPPLGALALAVGIAGAAYATVIAYTELPLAWSSWSGDAR